MNAAEVRAWLESYESLKSERDGILALIAELEEDRAASQLRSPQLTGMPRSGKVADPVPLSAQRFGALMERYEESAAALYDLMNEIEDALGFLPTKNKCRDIMRAHYLQGLTWPQVARSKNYSLSRVEHIASDAIKMLVEISK